MSRRGLFRAATVSARLVAGVAVSTAAVLGIVAAIAVPWPALTSAPATVDAEPAAADTVLSCAGPLLAAARQVEQARHLSAVAAEQLVSGSVAGGSIPDPSRLDLPGVSGGGAVVLRRASSGAANEPFAAASSAVAADADIRGFAASACQPALMDSWLVAGSTATGAADYVVLSNPGDVPATVDLTVYSAGEPVVPPGGGGVVVPARSQRVFGLSGLIRNEESPVVRVTASGAPVRATLQASIMRTLTPGGVDQVGAIPVAAVVQTIPGLRITAPPTEGADVTASMRLLSPSADTTATVRILPVGGAAPPAQDVPLRRGVPAAVDLSDLAVGTYTVEVDASVEVVAAAWAATGLGEGSDFAWHVAAPAIADTAQFAVAAGPSATLTLANTADAVATVRLTGNGTAATTVTVPAGASVETPVTAGAIYRIVTDVPIHGAVSYSGPGAVASAAVWPDDAAAPRIVVYP